MRAFTRWKAERGGSMIWVAVLMLAIPPMLLTMANAVRLLRAVNDVRSAANAACQAAAEAAPDMVYYRQMGGKRLLPARAQAEANAVYRQSLLPLVRRGVVQNTGISVNVSGATVYCHAQARYRVWTGRRTEGNPPPPWWLPPPVPKQSASRGGGIGKLTVTLKADVVSQARFGAH